MAEYIDREKTLRTLENTAKYYEMPNADKWTKGIHYGLIHGVDNIVDNVPIEDVIERSEYEKLKKENAELKIKYDDAEKRFCNAMDKNAKLRSKIDEAVKEIKALSPTPTAEDVIDGNPVKDAVWQTLIEVENILKRNVGE